MTRKTDLKIDGARIVARAAAPAAMALVALMLAAAPVTLGASGFQAPQAKADTSVDPLKTDTSSPDSVNAAGDNSSIDAGGQSVADGSKDSTDGSAGTNGSGSSNDTAASHDSSTSHDTAGSSHDGGNGGSDGGSDH